MPFIYAVISKILLYEVTLLLPPQCLHAWLKVSAHILSFGQFCVEGTVCLFQVIISFMRRVSWPGWPKKKLLGGAVVSTVASHQEGSRFDLHLGPFCVEFACSPRVCVGSLQVLRLPPTFQKHAC